MQTKMQVLYVSIVCHNKSCIKRPPHLTQSPGIEPGPQIH